MPPSLAAVHVLAGLACFWRAPRAVQTAAATLGGIAAPSRLENHGFEWFHSGVRARRVARARRPGLAWRILHVFQTAGSSLGQQAASCLFEDYGRSV